jgi:hypothetical protein
MGFAQTRAMLNQMLSKSLLIAATGTALLAALPAAAEGVGFRDTPFLPGQKYRVHDADRPVPKVLAPCARFSEMAPAPSDALVLFDGKDLSHWLGDNGPAQWKVENGYMEANDTGSIRTKEQFGDFQLHLEWATPTQITDSSQGRGNSGVIIHGRYELQVLDSYNNPTYADGHAGALYGQWPPLVNASRKPGEWQTYDIVFEAPRWEQDKLVKPANVTVFHNGVVLHHRKEFIGEVRHKEVARYGRPVTQGPIQLQDHHNPMRFRNVWIRPLGDYDKP